VSLSVTPHPVTYIHVNPPTRNRKRIYQRRTYWNWKLRPQLRVWNSELETGQRFYTVQRAPPSTLLFRQVRWPRSQNTSSFERRCGDLTDARRESCWTNARAIRSFRPFPARNLGSISLVGWWWRRVPTADRRLLTVPSRWGRVPVPVGCFHFQPGVAAWVAWHANSPAQLQQSAIQH